MENSGVVVNIMETHYLPQHEPTEEITLESVIMDRSTSRLFKLLVGCSASLDFIGLVASVCKQTKRIYLLDERIICYKNMITYCGPSLDKGISIGKAQTIKDALDCNCATARCLSQMCAHDDCTCNEKLGFRLTTLLTGNFCQCLMIRIAHVSSQGSMGLNCGNTRCYHLNT